MNASPLVRLLPSLPELFSLLSAGALLLLSGCATSDSDGKNLEALRRLYGPEAPDGIQDAVATPPHSMSRSDYPFDSRGNYREEWVIAPAPPPVRSPVSSSDGGSRSSSAVARGSVHVVKKGDTLYAISRHYGVTLYSLRKVNNLKSFTIRPGQRLRIPPQ